MVFVTTGAEFCVTVGAEVCVTVAADVLRKMVDKLNAPTPKKPGLLQVTSPACPSGFGVNVQLLPVSHFIVTPSQLT